MTDDTERKRAGTGNEKDPRSARDENGSKSANGTRRHPVLGVVFGLTRAVIAIGILVGGGYAAYWFNATEGRAQKSESATEEASRLVEIFEAKRGNHRVNVRAMGTVMAAREAVIRPRVSGTIVEQSGSFVPGGFFEAGAFMVQLERSDYEQILLQRRSDVARAEAALQIELGDQAVAREELELLEVDVPEINRDLILRIPQVNQARAELESAKAAVQRATLDLERTRIVAPFDGHLVNRAVSAGNNVGVGDELATFVGAERYWIELSLPVSSLRWIEVPNTPSEDGSRAIVRYPRAWGTEAQRDGIVTQLVGRLEPGSRMAQAIVTVADPLARASGQSDRPALILGAFVDVVIQGRELQGAFVIDRDLIRENDTVWVMGDDDRLVTKSVAIAYRGRDHAYVTDGIGDGDRVIRTNLQTPVDGMLLREAASTGATEGPLVEATASDV